MEDGRDLGAPTGRCLAGSWGGTNVGQPDSHLQGLFCAAWVGAQPQRKMMHNSKYSHDLRERGELLQPSAGRSGHVLVPPVPQAMHLADTSSRVAWNGLLPFRGFLHQVTF